MKDRHKYRVFAEAYNDYINEESLKLLSLRSDGQLIVSESGFEVSGAIEFSTGLLDKQGKLIFGRDIIEYCNHRYQVKWIEHMGEWQGQNKDDVIYGEFFKYTYRVGNIHSNPELLK